ncbi:MAG TPA: hypothetical protein VIU64_02755, partial [Polyangia bacterium]
LPTDGLIVEVDAEKERLPVSRIGRLVVRVKLPGGLSDKHAAGVERAVRSCPAYGTLLHSPSVELAIEADSPPAGRRHRLTLAPGLRRVA